MKERPILFSSSMVRAILDGRKSQTRRIVKPSKAFREWDSSPDRSYDVIVSDDGFASFLVAGDHGYTDPTPCPYGAPGDRLFITQTSTAVKGSDTEQRLWSLVHKQPSGCWEWFGRINRKGYGMLRWKGRHASVHRLSWELHRSAIPMGAHVLHDCDVPWCVNPDHLRLGDNDANITDKVERGRTVSQRGASNAAAVLTDEDIAEIRRLFYVDGWYQRDIAARYGVTQPHVSKILGGRRWAHESGVVEPQTFGSRTLDVTGVRVERLHEITEEDARSEGVEPTTFTRKAYPSKHAADVVVAERYRDSFELLWAQINGADSWFANPWVWVVEFRRAVAEERAA